MKKFTLLTIILFATVCVAFSQVPDAFNYQAVVRNLSGDVVASQSVTFKISVLQNSETGSPVYVETHSVTTNGFGLANLKIGKGTVQSGSFSISGWGAASHFVKVELDPEGGSSYSHLGTSQLLAVPYAFHANTVENDAVNDADADATNEIQTMSLSGTQLSLSDGGGTVTLPSSGGGDNWGTQTVKTDATLTGNGTTASKLCVVGDLSDDQTLSISGNDLTISDGNTVSLPAAASSQWANSSVGIQYNDGKVGIGHDPADDTGLLQVWEDDNVSIEAVNNSASYPTMYLQNQNGAAAVFNGAISITDGTEADGKVLTSDADGLASWQTSSAGLWEQGEDDIYYGNGKVGIGAAPTFDLDILNKTGNAILRLSSQTSSGNIVIDRASQDYMARIDYRNRNGTGTSTTGLYLGSPNFRIDATLTSELTGLEMETDGDVLLSDELHSDNTGDANMMPFAYGYISSTGTKNGGTSNIGTVTKMNTGQYKIEIVGLTNECAIIVTPNQGSASLTGVVSARNTTAFSVTMWETLSSAYKDAGFSFIVYKP